MAKKTGDPAIDALFAARKGKVELVDVPELGYAVVDGAGAPGGEAFAGALQALYSVSYGAHFALKKATGAAPAVMPLEALWWVEGDDARAVMERMAAGDTAASDAERGRWRWRAMILQLAPLDAAIVEAARLEAAEKKPNPALGALRYERWCEGECAQILHVGPYATEGATIAALHEAIAARGLRARGRHHEIYLGDPRTAAPEKLRTILRQPFEPAA